MLEKLCRMAFEAADAVEATLGVPLAVRQYPAQMSGDPVYAMVGPLRDEAFEAVALLGSNSGGVHVMESGDAGPRLVSCREGLTESMTRFIASGLDTPTVINLAVRLVDLLIASEVGGDGRWFFDANALIAPPIHGNVWVGLCGPEDQQWLHMVNLQQTTEGVEVEGPASTVNGPRPTFLFTRSADLDVLLQRLVDNIRDAVAARDAFVARVFSVKAVGERLLAAIDKRLPAEHEYRSVMNTWFGFPYYYPRGSIVHGPGKECLELQEEADGVRFRARGFVRRAGCFDDLECLMDELVEEVLSPQPEFSSASLKPGCDYRVIAELVPLTPGSKRPLPVGTILRFHRQRYIGYDSMTFFQFEHRSPPSTSAQLPRNENPPDDVCVELVDASPEHLELLRHLALWLEPVESS